LWHFASFRWLHQFGRNWSEADMTRVPWACRSDQIDPHRTLRGLKSRIAAVFSGGEELADLPILQASIVEIEGTWYEP
jgi:hypothetical protein